MHLKGVKASNVTRSKPLTFGRAGLKTTFTVDRNVIKLNIY